MEMQTQKQVTMPEPHPSMQHSDSMNLTPADTGLPSEDEHPEAGRGSRWWGFHEGHEKGGHGEEGGEEEGDETTPPEKKEGKSGVFGSLVSGMKRMGTKVHDKVEHGTQRVRDLIDVQKEVLRDMSDKHTYPELERDAALRRSNDISPEESSFLALRRKRIAECGALKRFLRLEEDVHPDDVPVIALGGSGGGYRACLGYLGMIEAMQDEDVGLWELLFYTSGVSGSCWSLGALYTFAGMKASYLLAHFAYNAKHHPLSAYAASAVARSAHGAYFQFGPVVQKLRYTSLHPGQLDIYGTFITSYMFLPALSPPHITVQEPPSKDGMIEASDAQSGKEQTKEDGAADEKADHRPALRREWFQWSRVWDRMGVDVGRQPMPILTAVRHERPWKDWKSPTEPFDRSDQASAEHKEASSAWWQWFEISPIEVGCDELEGWVPTWAFGRKFKAGKSQQRIPERSLALLLGMCTSAPAGPLSSYLGTIYRNLPHNVFGDSIRHLSEKLSKEWPKMTERFENHHPIHAVNEANPFFGAEKEPERGQGFENSPRVHLVDAGMSNNLPTYVFFRPHREVDVVLLGDYSSDVQKGSALERIAEGGLDKGLKIAPRDTLPPLEPVPAELDKDGKPKPSSRTPRAEEIEERFRGRYAQVLDAKPVQPLPTTKVKDGLEYNDRHVPLAQRECVAIYLPLIPNKCQPDYDPSTAAFSSSYNLVWTPEQVETIRRTSKANVKDSVDTIRTVIAEAYQKRKAARLQREGGTAR